MRNQSRMEQKSLVVVDGIVASGKTTLISKLVDRLGAKVIAEPVDQWQRTGILSKYYSDMKRWAYTFQTNAFSTRTKAFLDSFQGEGIFLSERFLSSDKVFMNMLHQDGVVTDMEMTLYNGWCDMWTNMLGVHPSLIVYKRTPLDTCMRWYERRARPGEVLDVEYQVKLQKEYDKLYSCSDEDTHPHLKYVMLGGTYVPVLVITTPDEDELAKVIRGLIVPSREYDISRIDYPCLNGRAEESL